MKRIVVILISLFFLSISYSQTIKSVKIGDLEKEIAESKNPVIVNFWATWCKPCIEELPYFLYEYNKHKKDSLQLLLVSLDFEENYPAGISTFARKRKINAPIVWLNETNADVFCPKIDSAWSGAIPASLFINRKSGYRSFYQTQISHEMLKKEISAILK